jgi:lysophospholipid acyltransferase (LPLAT)-like uncharacterized protein
MKVRSRWLIRWAGRALAMLARALFLLVRTEVRQTVPGTCCYDDLPDHYIYCLWHDAVLGVIFGGKPIDMAGLVSQHEDGSYLADAMEAVNITPIRGSSRRGGTVAMKQMIDAAAKKHIAIATDGPRGPRRVVKEGIVFLAAQSGKAILPAGVSATRAWRPRGRWSDMLVPKPFSKLVIVVGAPITIPAEATREEREVWRQRIQQEMDRLNDEADRVAGHEPHRLVLPMKAKAIERRAA